MFRLERGLVARLRAAAILSSTLLLGACGKPGAGAAGSPLAAGEVRMNGVTMSAEQLRAFGESFGGAQLKPGNYWYDKDSGLWGNAGEGAGGVLPLGINFPGTLAPAHRAGTAARLLAAGS